MKYFFLIIIFFFVFFSLKNTYAQPYKKLHQQSIVIDTHNDVLTECFEKGYSFDQNLKGKTHSDLQRFKQGGVDVQIFSVWCDGLKQNLFSYANRQIDTLYATALRHPGKITVVKTSAELLNAVHNKKLAAIIGIEGGHMIENDITKLDSLFKRGSKYMTLTWNNSTDWATSAKDETASSKLPLMG